MTNGIKYSIIQAAIAQMNELNAAYCPGNCGILTKVFSDTPRRCNKCRLTIGPGVSCCECRTCDYDMCIDCYVPLLEGRDVISTLSLARSGLTCEEIERLASLLETNSTITRLDLRNNRLEDSGAMFLSRMLMKNCTLRELELGNENIDDGTSDQNKITCDGAEALADALKVNQTLRVLNLVNNQIGETGAVAFAAALRKNHKLVDLFLESNKIGPAGVAALDSPVSCYRAHGYATSQDFDASKSYIINITQPKEVKTAEERIFMLNPLSQLPRSGKIKMTLEGTLDTMYEIWEKKCIADQVDFNVGNDPVALTDFLFDYFFQKYGVKKMAEIKLRDFIISLFNYKEQHRRIPSFLQILGLEDEVSFSRLPGDFMCSMIARNFKEDLKSIKEHLDEDPDYVETNRAINLVIGFEAKRTVASNWDCPLLKRLASVEDIKAMLCDIEGLPQHQINGQANYDLDDVLELVLQRCSRWCKVAFDALASVWERETEEIEIEGGAPTRLLGPEAFASIARSICGVRDASEIERKWMSLKLHLGYEPKDPGIDHPVLFAAGCVQVGLIPMPLS